MSAHLGVEVGEEEPQTALHASSSAGAVNDALASGHSVFQPSMWAGKSS